MRRQRIALALALVVCFGLVAFAARVSRGATPGAVVLLPQVWQSGATVIPTIPSSSTATATSTIGVPLPDLVVQGMSIELESGGACLNSPGQLGVRVTIANLGPMLSGPFILNLNGTAHSVAGGLAGGEQRSLWVPNYQGALNTATVDSTMRVAESDEGNNTLALQLPVPTPPVSCTPTSTVEPTPTGTITVTPTATTTPTATPPAGDGVAAVRLRPVAAVVEQAYQPRRIVLVLDASGSMNMNVAGQGIRNGQITQCTNGPAGAPPDQNCATPQSAWPTVAERRIYIAKRAGLRLIAGLNMPNNAGYNPALPADQLAIVWFNSSSASSNTFGPASDPAALAAALLSAGAIMGDPYLTDGGTNTAAGMYRTSLLLANQPRNLVFNGRPYSYAQDVILISDGIANTFLNLNSPTLYGGASNANTYPSGHYCRSLGNRVVANAPCMTNEIGGLYNGKNRPITEYVIRAKALQLDARSIVITIGHVDDTGYRTGAASSPADYYPLPTIAYNAQGNTELDLVIDQLLVHPPVSGETCRTALQPWTGQIDAAHLPAGLPLGTVQLAGSSGVFQASIVRDPQSGALSAALPAMPAGDYTLSASLSYKGDDGATRSYSLLYDAASNTSEPGRQLSLPGGVPQLPEIMLLFGGNACAP